MRSCLSCFITEWSHFRIGKRGGGGGVKIYSEMEKVNSVTSVASVKNPNWCKNSGGERYKGWCKTLTLSRITHFWRKLLGPQKQLVQIFTFFHL